MMFTRRIAAAAVLGLILAAQPIGAQARDLTIFAAASMKTALDAINEAYTREAGDKIIVSYAASSALAKQLEAGAPADVFISADQDWMNYVGERDLIDPATRRDILANRIVLIAPSDSRIPEMVIEKGFPLADLLGDGRIAMGNVESVPAGKYGKAALERLGSWDGVSARVAQTDNVRAALLLVSRGEAPLGIVYQTDAVVDKGVKVIGMFPEDSHEPIIYPIAAIKGSGADSARYLEFLKSVKPRQIFESQGFQVLD